MAEDLGERSEDATPRRLEEAREEGNVPKSQDFASATMLIAVTFIIWMAALNMLGQSKHMFMYALSGDTLGDPVDPGSLWPFIRFLSAAAVRIILPVLALAWFIGALSHIGQIGWMFSPKAVAPKLEKLNPLKGFKRIFGLNALVKASLDVGKVAIVVAVVMLTVHQYTNQVAVLPYLTAFQGMVMIGKIMFDVALRVLGVLLLLGVFDLLYQRWRHRNDMKMTKQQVKDEMKQTEGDPDVKRRRMRMQQQIAMQRISSAVPGADVIVTNPEHYAVAIAYDQQSMNAPKVVAKGADYLALRIRQLAMKHNVPIVERKPLARALYRDVKVGQEVPAEFFKAIAEILAYVYRLSGRMAG